MRATVMANEYQEKDLDNQPLLESESQDGTRDSSLDSATITQNSARRKRPQYFQWLLYALAIAYIPLIVLYIFLFLGIPKPSVEPDCKNANLDTFPSLARSSAIQFEQRPFPVRIHHNPFAGDPRPELDAAWHEIFESQPFPPVPPFQMKNNNLKTPRHPHPRLKRRPRLLQPYLHPLRRRVRLRRRAGRPPRTALSEENQTLDLQRLLPHQRNRSRNDRMARSYP